MNISEKITLANKVAISVIGVKASLIDELRDFGAPEMLRDEDFLGQLSRRALICEDCGTWRHPEDIEDGICSDCFVDDWEDEA